MSQNPYQPSTGSPSSATFGRLFSGHSLCALIGSIVLILFGIAVAGLGMLAMEAPWFFLHSGAHLIACGAIAMTCVWGDRRGRVWYPLYWASLFLNAALVMRIIILILLGTIRGPLIVAGLVLIGLPAGAKRCVSRAEASAI